MIDMSNGSLYFGDLDFDKPIELASGILYTDDIPLSQYEEQEISWRLLPTKTDEVTFTIDAIDLELLNNMTHIQTSDKFTLKYNKPIMIQARWHKRHRINKKWQKRFGMKQDTVEVSCNARTCEYSWDECHFDIDASCMKYNLKPHQKRRNLKIEW